MVVEIKSVSAYKKRGELALEILRYIAIASIVGGSFICPNLIQVITLFKPKSSPERQRIGRSIQSLERKGFVALLKGNRIELTALGRSWVEFESLQIPVQKWDRKWRVFMFDIPERKKHARMLLSRKVQEMGMCFLQRSVFVSPYPCEEELLKVCTFLDVTDCIQLLIVTKMYDEKRLMKRFKISGINS